MKQGVVLLLLLLMTFLGLGYPCWCSKFRLWGAGSWNGHYNSQSAWCSLLTSTVGLRVWEGARAGGCEGTRVGRTSVIAGEELTLELSECVVHRDLDKDRVDRQWGSQLEEKVQDCR